MAIQMKYSTKFFQDALSLNPLHPDALNHYGEYMEVCRKDIIKANHFYTQALTISPQHSQALLNRERTLPLVEKLYQNQLIHIDKKRDHLAHVLDTVPSLKQEEKEAYFQHLDHTLAIVGTSMSLLGKSIVEHNEVLGLESAMKYIISMLVSKKDVIRLDDILQIHRRVLGHVDPLGAGKIRNAQVCVGEYTPPKPDDILSMMDDFIDWLNSEEAYKMHPVKYAALVHYKLVHIHPFVDGNGRTSRLLMNLILMRAGYPPIVIQKQDKSFYNMFLQFAHEGDVMPFMHFVAVCTDMTLNVCLFATEYHLVHLRAVESQDD